MLRNIYLLLFGLLMTISLSAQNSLFLDEENDDTLLLKKYRMHDGHWAGIDLGMNVLLNSSFGRDFGLEPQWKNAVQNSWNINLNILDHKFLIEENKLGLTVGLGINYSQTAFTKNFFMYEAYDSVTKQIEVFSGYDKVNYSRDKLRVIYLQVPLLLEFTPIKNSWISAGVVGGYRVGSSTRVDIEDKKTVTILKTRGTFNLKPFKLDATIRGGYKDWGAFVTYSLVPMFKTSKNVDVHPFSFGLSFNY
ncbi:MAG: outer membrane beta-barrel protein [Crocinitomicaceae bacterium]|nr:outer membrane beta-barrel protein [Crocinitomicaceae bacterium]